MKINATIEYLPGGEALVDFYDEFGGWQGCGLVACRSGRRSDLYEAGYTFASVTVAAKSGKLETFREL